MRPQPAIECSIQRTLDLVGDRWTLLILRDLFRGVRRFSRIQEDLGIARNLLTDRLATLVDADIVEKVPYQERPVRHEYRLTEKGRALSPALLALMRWGDRYVSGGLAPTELVHDECDTRLELSPGAPPATCRWPPPTSPLGRVPVDTLEPRKPVSDLHSLSGNDLFALARARRDAAFGSVVTYSPKVFIPLTMLCRDKCGYCTFAQPPARLDTPYLEPDDVLAIARQGAEMGCHEALFTLGEKPELRYPVARDWLNRHGYDSTVHYVAAMAQLVLDETGLLPNGNTGAMNRDELALLRTVTPSQGMMLESLRGDLDAHRGAPDKMPARRLETLEWAGELQIPYTTGILVGIGENRADRIEALEAIARATSATATSRK